MNFPFLGQLGLLKWNQWFILELIGCKEKVMAFAVEIEWLRSRSFGSKFSILGRKLEEGEIQDHQQEDIFW